MEDISELNCPSLTEDQSSELKNNGIITLMDIILQDKAVAMNAGHFSTVEYCALKQDVLRLVQPSAIAAGGSLSSSLSHQSQESFFSTGVQRLDEFLRGGLRGSEVLEIYGESGTGKTQMCHRISAQFCHFHPDKPTVAYFDLKGDFSATRLLRFGQGVQKDLCNVHIIQPTSILETLSDIDELKDLMVNCDDDDDFHPKLKLVVFDSVPLAIHPAVDEDVLSWRFYEEKFMEKVLMLSKLNNGIVIILVNHTVKARKDKKPSTSGNVCKVKAALDSYWRGKINFRLQLSQKDNSNLYHAFFEKSSRTDSNKMFAFSIKDSAIECL